MAGDRLAPRLAADPPRAGQARHAERPGSAERRQPRRRPLRRTRSATARAASSETPASVASRWSSMSRTRSMQCPPHPPSTGQKRRSRSGWRAIVTLRCSRRATPKLNRSKSPLYSKMVWCGGVSPGTRDPQNPVGVLYHPDAHNIDDAQGLMLRIAAHRQRSKAMTD